jgi:hypothetical protein
MIATITTTIISKTTINSKIAIIPTTMAAIIMQATKKEVSMQEEAKDGITSKDILLINSNSSSSISSMLILVAMEIKHLRIVTMRILALMGTRIEADLIGKMVVPTAAVDMEGFNNNREGLTRIQMHQLLITIQTSSNLQHPQEADQRPIHPMLLLQTSLKTKSLGIVIQETITVILKTTNPISLLIDVQHLHSNPK